MIVPADNVRDGSGFLIEKPEDFDGTRVKSLHVPQRWRDKIVFFSAPTLFDYLELVLIPGT